MQNKYSYLNNANPVFIEELYTKYLNDPTQIEEKWRIFFDGYEIAKESNLTEKINGKQFDKESQVTKLIQAYRYRGHMIANTNPLSPPKKLEELDLSYYHLDNDDLDTVFNAGHNLNIGHTSLKQIFKYLKKTYASTMGLEFVHCSSEIRKWIYSTIEPIAASPQYDAKKKKNTLKYLCRATLFEDFLSKKYIGQKRFGLEGCDVLIPGLFALISKGASLGNKEFVIGMAHRGRLNVLVNILKKSFYSLFTEFEGGKFPKDIQGHGDVKYHLGQSADLKIEDYNIHLSLAFNPSHLEAVSSIVQGITQGKSSKHFENDINKVIPIIIHGDAAVTGQGIVYELANLNKLKGYNNGGTIHIVLNNQIGFTASAEETRSGSYCTDVAKMTDSPIFHVNANDVEKVIYVFELAIEMRKKFNIDIWIELIGYRRFGHNEGDEPRFTQPLMYQKISQLPNVYEIYLKKLLEEKSISQKEVNNITEDYLQALQKDLDLAKEKKSLIQVDTLHRFWGDIRSAKPKDFEKNVNTKVDINILSKLMEKTITIPKDFKIFNKLKKIFDNRHQLFFDKKLVDWAMAEQLAFASLLNEGTSIRLTGQDSQRGTFSHRHAVVKNVETGKEIIPLKNCEQKNGKFNIYNSMLSEYAVLGFEYGYSSTRPHSLVIWEAQFGDFANGAQIIIDQFISSGEVKWQRHSGLVLLLPHGYEGMGPEHSSARLERFLQLCAVNNMYVTNPTTPANFFHLLRRQICSPFRKPLIVMSPKSLLRNPDVKSDIEELSKGSFQEVIDDNIANPNETKRVILTSGKIYYQLLERRKNMKKENQIALVRVEQLYPLIESKLNRIKEKYNKAKEWIWVQEEPENMGAWLHIKENLSDWGLICYSRKASASPASGVFNLHQKNQEKILELSINKN